jgi:hypothetical protein
MSYIRGVLPKVQGSTVPGESHPGRRQASPSPTLASAITGHADTEGLGHLEVELTGRGIDLGRAG